MNTQLKKFLIYLTCSLSLVTDVYAIQLLEITTEKDSNCHQVKVYQMTGAINQDDSIYFADVVNEMKIQHQDSCKGKEAEKVIPPIIKLNSTGGNLDESIKIGEIIRKNEFWTFVQLEHECLSSCVFILAAGTNRLVHGKVGIHRPYFLSIDVNESIDSIKSNRNDVLTIAKRYLLKMDVNPSLVDLMISIPPNKIKILSSEELSYFRLSGEDANHEEKNIAESAWFYGLTSVEFRERSSIADQKCDLTIPSINGSIEKSVICRRAILFGISENKYKIREQQFRSQCSEELPITELRECFRKVMNSKN